MHQILLNITEEQKKQLIKIKKEEDIPITVQIRNAIDNYLNNKKNHN